jgi:hypothetical protein
MLIFWIIRLFNNYFKISLLQAKIKLLYLQQPKESPEIIGALFCTGKFFLTGY